MGVVKPVLAGRILWNSQCFFTHQPPELQQESTQTDFQLPFAFGRTYMSFDETYFDETSHVRLHCDGPDCWVEIRQKPVDRIQISRQVHVEFLLQPRDSAQQPLGEPILLHVQHVQLTYDPKTHTEHGWRWLPPRLTREFLARCHLRLRDDRDGGQSGIE